MQYGKTLKLIRDKRAFSLGYVAEEIGISPNRLIEIEGQPQIPDIETLTKLSDFYQVPINIIEHFSIDHDINGNEDEQKRKELKDRLAHALHIEESFDFNQVVDDLRELRQLKTEKEGIKAN